MSKIEATASVTLYEDFEEKNLEEMVIDLAAEKLAERFYKDAKDEICKKADQIIYDRVAEAINDALNTPWQKTDSWGNPCGEPCTLADLIRKKLDEVVGDSYDRNKQQPRISALVTKAVTDALNNEMKDVIPQVREQFKAAVDGTLTAQIRKVLTDGLGIKA